VKVYVLPLDAEAIPDGTFAGTRHRGRTRTPTSPEQAAEHRAALLAALNAPPDPDTAA
jgi:hypothetical protein